MRAYGCPEPEVLAAYVDHGLSLAERARVETHLASCPECIALLAGVVQTVAEVTPALPNIVRHAEVPPPDRRRAVAIGAAAAAAVIAVLTVPSLLEPWFERDAGLVSLAGNVGEHRSVLGRLTGGIPHAPLDAASAGGQDVRASGTDRVLLTAGRIRESIGESATPSRLHALGVSQLFERRLDDAAELLLAASRQQPANARYLNDVATVQLERARLGLRPDDLPRALAAADRARRLDPSLQEAWFNRALAMSALQLTDQAKAAWGEYLRRDSTSPWAGEARKRLEDLSKPTPAAAWAAIEGRLQQHIDAETAESAVRTHVAAARRYIEDVLIPNWADAVLAGNNGEPELERVRAMAEAMLRVTGDAVYSDAVAAMERQTGTDAKPRLAKAHKTFANGSALFYQDRFGDAAPVLANAVPELKAIGSGLAVLGEVRIAAVQYVTGEQEQADRRLAAAHAEAVSKNYQYAMARASWFRGLIAFAAGRFSESQSFYEETLSTFERMGDVEHASMVHGLLSGLHFSLGNPAAEWEHRRAALAGLDATGSTRFKYSVLLAGALSIRTTNPEAALFLFDGVVAAARQSGRVAAVVDAMAQRAATLAAIGSSAEARASVDDARRQLASVRDDSLRRLLELPVLAVESDLLRHSDPAAAVLAAQRALDTANARGERSRLPQLHLRLAKANIVSGRLDAAERSLAAGIEAFDAMRNRQKSTISSTDESWQLFETAVQLAIRRGDHERAFAMAERGRQATSQASSLPVLGLTQAQRAQSTDTAVIAINQFDDELALWVIRQRGTTVVRRPMQRVDAERIVARHQDEIRLETNHPVAGAILYDEIVRPIANQLDGVERIVIVPDRTYQDVSFPALWDRTQDRFVVEKWNAAAAPTVSLAASRHDADTTQPDTSVLILGAGNDAERAKTIAGQYREARIAVGDEATRAQLFASNSTVVHLAAVTRRNNTYPAWSALRLNDEPGRAYSGAVMGRDIAASQLSAQLVILDELRSGNRYRTVGTFDLATAFLAAGVPAVLGTLPGADEAVTRELIVGLHRHLAAQVPAEEALARVQRNALQENGRRLGAWTALVLYGSDR